MREAAPRAVRTAWILHEAGFQPYFTLINVVLFSSYFVNVLAGDPVTGQVQWGYTQAAIGAVLAIFSPILGAVADRSGRPRRWLLALTLAGAAFASGLWWARPGAPLAAVVACLVAANCAIEFAAIFSGALLPRIAPERGAGVLSGSAYAVSQVSGVLATALVLAAFQFPATPWLGLDRAAHEPERILGPLCAVLLLAFMLPLAMVVDDRPRAPIGRAVREGLSGLARTVRSVRHYGNVARFLFASMLYRDGLQGIFLFSSLFAGSVFGWKATELGIFGVAATLSAALGGAVGTLVDARLGPRRTVLAFLTGVVATSALLATCTPDGALFLDFGPPSGTGPFARPGERAYFALGCLFGFCVGPALASSRALLARLAPLERSSEFFGLFAMTGRATSFVGPLLIATVTAATGSQRMGLLAIAALVAAGLVALAGVREKRSEDHSSDRA